MKPTHASRTPSAAKKSGQPPARRWSQHVTDTSDSLDLEDGVFRKVSARAIAASLKRSADRSRRRKTDSFRSAMSMLTFYVNRAGKTLSAERRRVLQAAKDALRQMYGREQPKARTRARAT